ncbi:hypothetical protein P5673_026955 [Acropora cervicornis]|uniref:Uncharacterized protein n=1 Tax=Acropora cervicornis TaxID=6130 RepID=A0AAD9UVY1_ACRCE|nr:hypothetical protein P5673_026955 [Acropora cervicornis]
MELLLKQQQFLQMQAYMAQKQQQQYKMLMAILEKKIEKNEGALDIHGFDLSFISLLDWLNQSPPASQLEKGHKAELTAAAKQSTKRKNPSRQSPPSYLLNLWQASKRKGDDIT